MLAKVGVKSSGPPKFRFAPMSPVGAASFAHFQSLEKSAAQTSNHWNLRRNFCAATNAPHILLSDSFADDGG